MSKTLYAAGPITGLTYKQASEWRQDGSDFVERAKALGWTVLSPMRGKSEFDLGEKVLTPYFDEGEAAVRRDLLDVRTASVVVFNLLGYPSISLGSMAEMGVAHTLGKRIIVVMDGDNPHHHVFTEFMADEIVPDLESVLISLAAHAVPYA